MLLGFESGLAVLGPVTFGIPGGVVPGAPGPPGPPGAPPIGNIAFSSCDGSVRYCTTSIVCSPREISSQLTRTVTLRTDSCSPIRIGLQESVRKDHPRELGRDRARGADDR